MRYVFALLAGVCWGGLVCGFIILEEVEALWGIIGGSLFIGLASLEMPSAATFRQALIDAGVLSSSTCLSSSLFVALLL